MSDETWVQECPHCGFEGAITGHYGSYVNVSYCSLCGWNEPEPRGDIAGEMYSYIRDENPDLDEESDEFQDKLHDAAQEWVESEAGKTKIPNKKDIARSRQMQHLIDIGFKAFEDDMEYNDYLNMEEDVLSHTEDMQDFMTYLIKTNFGDENRW